MCENSIAWITTVLGNYNSKICDPHYPVAIETKQLELNVPGSLICRPPKINDVSSDYGANRNDKAQAQQIPVTSFCISLIYNVVWLMIGMFMFFWVITARV